ncbi:hypothetical protein RUND412_001035 [Rhizina undulata]
MDIQGERFSIDDFDLGFDEANGPVRPPLSLGFVKDIVEKPTSSAPAAPVLPPNASTATGFPEHKKRIRGSSKFKQRAQQDLAAQRARTQVPLLSAQKAHRAEDERSERQRISDENERRLASMSQDEIEEERRELMEKLSPNLIEALLKRAKIEDETSGSFTTGESSIPTLESSPPSSVPSGRKPAQAAKKAVTFEDVEEMDEDDKESPAIQTVDKSLLPQPPSIHFPKPPITKDTEDLDPASPEFLERLHTKYFPDLPADPSRLAWMAPVSSAEDSACYHPSQSELPASALRFDFRGNLLPPRKAREMPANLGLHHHADAPNAAGYTIPELARLARSSFPSQKCMAMQTLGRIMYKLGTGVYQVEDINRGLWRCLEEGRVLEGLEEAATGKQGGHMSVKTYATEALW